MCAFCLHCELNRNSSDLSFPIAASVYPIVVTFTLTWLCIWGSHFKIRNSIEFTSQITHPIKMSDFSDLSTTTLCNTISSTETKQKLTFFLFCLFIRCINENNLHIFGFH